MIRFENECCSCAVPGYPCRGSSCSLRHVPHYYCDDCGEDVEVLYEFGGRELCIDCIEERLTPIEAEWSA